MYSSSSDGYYNIFKAKDTHLHTHNGDWKRYIIEGLLSFNFSISYNRGYTATSTYYLLRESEAFIIELTNYIQFKLTLFLENRNHTQNLI